MQLKVHDTYTAISRMPEHLPGYCKVSGLMPSCGILLLLFPWERDFTSPLPQPLSYKFGSFKCGAACPTTQSYRPNKPNLKTPQINWNHIQKTLQYHLKLVAFLAVDQLWFCVKRAKEMIFAFISLATTSSLPGWIVC